jgi:sortase A
MIARVRLHAVRRAVVRLAADLLILAGVSGVLIWAWALSEGAFYQFVQEAHISAPPPARSASVAAGVTGEGVPPQPEVVVPTLSKLLRTFPRDPRVIGRLEAPSIHLSVVVRDGIDDETLRKAVGRLPSSALPGEPGNLVVLGHRDTFFRPLRNLERGQSIRFHTARGQFEYVVESVQVVEPGSVNVVPTADAVTTLITCFPFDYVGTAPRRFVVRARFKEPL